MFRIVGSHEHIEIDGESKLWEQEMKLEAIDSGKSPAVNIAIFWCLCALLFVGFIVGSACFEASAYNRITGSNVTTWDAVWLDLRVNGSPTTAEKR